jgi:hypothetical protein
MGINPYNAIKLLEAENATLKERVSTLETLVRQAQSILADYLVPDGLSEQETLSELLGLLDGPQSRAALSTKTPSKAPDSPQERT